MTDRAARQEQTTMAFTLGAQSRARLKNVHPDLVISVQKATGTDTFTLESYCVELLP